MVRDSHGFTSNPVTITAYYGLQFRGCSFVLMRTKINTFPSWAEI